MILYSSWFQSTSWIPFLLLAATSAQTIQQVIWNVPDGDLADLSQTFIAGQTLPLSWNAYSSTQFVDTTKNLVDLWVTAFDFNLNPFTQRVTTGIDLRSPGNFAWTISIPDGNLTISAKYVLRFKITSPVFNQSNGDLSSPGFLVLRPATVSSSSISSLASTFSSRSSSISNSPSGLISVSAIISSSSSISASVTAAGTISTSSATAGPPSSGLSSGAKGGIGAGIGVLIFALGGLFCFFWWTRRRKGMKGNAESGEILEENKNGTNLAEMPAKIFVAELPVDNH